MMMDEEGGKEIAYFVCVCVKICKINQVRIVISVAFRDIIAFCQDISHHSGGVGFASIAMHSFD